MNDTLRRVNIWLTPAKIKVLRQLALDTGSTLQRLGADALRGVLRAAGREVT